MLFNGDQRWEKKVPQCAEKREKSRCSGVGQTLEVRATGESEGHKGVSWEGHLQTCSVYSL